MPNHQYRVVYHDHDGHSHAICPQNGAEDTPDQMDFLLEHYLDSGYATGGHVEVHVPGIGWVVCD